MTKRVAVTLGIAALLAAPPAAGAPAATAAKRPPRAAGLKALRLLQVAAPLCPAQRHSAYLHPAGDDLLIGVGPDATRGGRALGTQLSLFDVSDLRNPRRMHRRTVAASTSEVEFDHHAFL